MLNVTRIYYYSSERGKVSEGEREGEIRKKKIEKEHKKIYRKLFCHKNLMWDVIIILINRYLLN